MTACILVGLDPNTQQRDPAAAAADAGSLLQRRLIASLRGFLLSLSPT